ncbi:hypothetical protein JZS45_004571 [Salmonella enterica]|nr:hypothetical protein [Salmonella enterica]
MNSREIKDKIRTDGQVVSNFFKERGSDAVSVPGPSRDLKQWVERQQFLSAVESAHNWLAMLRYHGVRYNWSEVGLLLAMTDNISRDLQNTAPTDCAAPESTERLPEVNHD